ncbi:MAG: hypothetical protein ACKVX7_15085 [Planctomycetota bacterium]
MLEQRLNLFDCQCEPFVFECLAHARDNGALLVRKVAEIFESASHRHDVAFFRGASHAIRRGGGATKGDQQTSCRVNAASACAIVIAAALVAAT